MFCNGAWGGGLLAASAPLGTCTLNHEDCGKVRGGGVSGTEAWDS
jgi:hypothetical protein